MRVLMLAVVVCVSIALAPVETQRSQRVGVVTGTVMDVAGAAIPGADVRLAARGFTTRSTVTNESGTFRFDAVPAGGYVVTVALTGFKTATRRIAVTQEAITTVSMRLELSALTETVTVMAQSATPSSTTSSLAVSNAAPASSAARRGKPPAFNTEAYDRIEDNPFKAVRRDPLSTFSIDVDTASYANVRKFLGDGELPPADAVRIEEMINYFRFDYPSPKEGEPFSVTTELAPCPWSPSHRLALIGLQARRLPGDVKRARSLVFLLDVSGSMEPADKLPLIRTAMRMLVDTLTAADRISIVVYAGASGLVLPTTAGDQKDRIHQALARLEAGGSTNGADGITLAYRVAQEQFIEGGINRVILATDGDFNVGVTSEGELIRLIEQKREAGVFLSVLGVGRGNLNDSMMEKLADKGNGNYAYLDSLHEARKVLVGEAGSTLETVAKDVKIQVEFNPRHVAGYRLIGYENRILNHEDFNDDSKDAGEIGAGHTVTALYEIVPLTASLNVPGVDPLKYQQPGPLAASSAHINELMTIKLRYKQPNGGRSRLMAVAVQNVPDTLAANAAFAAAVAQFGMLLRESPYRGTSTFASAIDLARRFSGSDEHGYRAEFVRLVELAAALRQQQNKTDDAVTNTRK